MSGLNIISLFFSQYGKLWDQLGGGFVYLFDWAPLWLPPILVMSLIRMYGVYTRTKYFANLKYIVLEIRVPKEVLKTPLAMEVVLAFLNITNGESSWYDRFFLGKRRAFFALELVSIEGQIHFFIRTNAAYKELIQNQIYSQYPSAEISEVPDYTAAVPYGTPGSDWELFGIEYAKVKADPYPIKTYVDFALDKQGIEEPEKIDPMTPTLEFLGALKGYEQVWIQFIIRGTKGIPKPGLLHPFPERVFFSKKNFIPWSKIAKDEVKKIYKSYDDPHAPASIPTNLKLTKGDQDIVAAIEKTVSKLGFDTGIRAIYIARKDSFRALNISGMYGMFKQYSSMHLNSFKPGRYTAFDYPWEDFKGMRLRRRKAKMFDAYRRRGWFFPPHLHRWYIMNTEELATMFHFPGGVAETPTFGRITSKKAEPPQNLPM